MEQQFELNFSPPSSSPDVPASAEKKPKHPLQAAFDMFIDGWPDGQVYPSDASRLGEALLGALDEGSYPKEHARLSEAVASARDDAGLAKVSEVAQQIIAEITE